MKHTGEYYKKKIENFAIANGFEFDTLQDYESFYLDFAVKDGIYKYYSSCMSYRDGKEVWTIAYGKTENRDNFCLRIQGEGFKELLNKIKSIYDGQDLRGKSRYGVYMESDDYYGRKVVGYNLTKREALALKRKYENKQLKNTEVMLFEQ